jgi:hypothetical protein
MLLSRSAELRALVECSLSTARELLAQGTSTIESPEEPMLHKLVDTLEKVRFALNASAQPCGFAAACSGGICDQKREKVANVLAVH